MEGLERSKVVEITEFGDYDYCPVLENGMKLIMNPDTMTDDYGIAEDINTHEKVKVIFAYCDYWDEGDISEVAFIRL